MRCVLIVSWMIAIPLFAQQFKEERDLNVNLTSNRDTVQVNLYELNQSALREDFQIRMINTQDDKELQNAIIHDRNGKAINFRIAIRHNEKEYILGTTHSERSLIVSSISVVNRHTQITFSAVDRNGDFVSDISRDEVSIFDNSGRQQCFDFDKASSSNANVATSVGIAIDISGSMGGFENQINASINKFLGKMPQNAYCSIIEFDHAQNILMGGTGQKQLCNSLSNFNIRSPGGGTNIYPALNTIYDLVGEQNSPINMVLVVSDGASQEDQNELNTALQKKSDIPTFVNWLGHYNADYALAQFADAAVFGSISQDGALPDFFEKAGASVGNQFVARSCTPQSASKI